jgi:hypothetical protein
MFGNQGAIDVRWKLLCTGGRAGANRRLMAKIALRPLTVWAGGWYADSYARTVAQDIIDGTSTGNPDVLSQIAILRLQPGRSRRAPGRGVRGIRAAIAHGSISRRGDRKEVPGVTLGIPPSTEVANPRWGLSRGDRTIATKDADAYLWAGRPWVDNGTGSLVFSRALQLAASTPYG